MAPPKKNVKVDPTSCIGCGLCTSIAPQTFSLNEEGKATATNPPTDEEAAVQTAIDSCPVSGLAWEN